MKKRKKAKPRATAQSRRRTALWVALRMLLWVVVVLGAFGGALYGLFAWSSAQKPKPPPPEEPTRPFPDDRIWHEPG